MATVDECRLLAQQILDGYTPEQIAACPNLREFIPMCLIEANIIAPIPYAVWAALPRDELTTVALAASVITSILNDQNSGATQ